MKLGLGLYLIKVDSYTKYQVNMFKCFEEKFRKVMFFFGLTDGRTDWNTDRQSATPKFPTIMTVGDEYRRFTKQKVYNYLL